MAKKVIDKRLAALYAALDLITEKGFHATPMSEVAEKAGIAIGTIYHYFESKEDLINALYITLKKEMSDALVKNDNDRDDAKTRFVRFWRNLYDYFTRNPKAFMFLSQYDNSPFIANISEEQSEVFYKPVVDFFAASIKSGEFRKMNVTLMTWLVYGNVETVARLEAQQGKLAAKDVQAAIECSWNSVAAL